MNLAEYLDKRRQVVETRRLRQLCMTCLQPLTTCYCRHVVSFDPLIHFVILIHPVEVRRRIATGRMSHLCLQNSRLIMGYDYSNNESVNQILHDAGNECVILYPGRSSVNLTAMARDDRSGLFSRDKKLVVFVLDGTWSTAKKMLRRSQNLHYLPRIAFTPPRPSNFRVRQQPKPECFSTVEAIHHVVELLGPARGFDLQSKAHDRLLYVFDKMVEQQLGFIRVSHLTRTHSRHRRPPTPRTKN